MARSRAPIREIPSGKADPWDLLAQRAGVVLGLVTILLPVFRYRRTSSKPIRRQTGPPERTTSWPGMLIATLGYLILGILAWRPLPSRQPEIWRRRATLIGAALYFPGVGLYWWGYWTLGDLFRPSSSRRADLFLDHELRVIGPYAIVRHPMYLGVLLAAAGALLIYKTWTMLFYSLSALVVILRARHEEGALAAAFGSDWVAYCARVPAWVPAFRRAPEKANRSNVGRSPKGEAN